MADHASLKTRHLVFYGIGSFGWSLAMYGVNNLLNYFYMPNVVDGASMFPEFIYRGQFFFQMTLIGMLIAGGRFFDAITDPIIAGLSDRFQSRWGRRRVFMAIGALPLALTSFLAFLPPFRGAVAGNAVYLGVILVIYFLSFTLYVTPSAALVSELAHSSKERLNMSTYSSVGWSLGFMVGNMSYAIQDSLEAAGMESAKAFQLEMGMFALLSLVILYVPVLFIDEHKFSKNIVSTRSSFKALVATVKNRNFRFFLGSELSYWFALTFIQSGIAYYVVTLMDLPKSYATYLMTSLFLISFLFYVPINLVARRFGKKMTEMIAFWIFLFVYILIFLLGRLPVPMGVQAGLLALLGGIPMGVLMIVPYAIIADMAEEEGLKTGNYNAGIFYAMRGLFMKIGTSLAGLVFPSVLLWGAAEVNETGIRMTSLFGLAFCFIGFLFILFYNEKSVLKTLRDHQEE